MSNWELSRKRICKNNNNNNFRFLDLPSEILPEILSRLPVKSILVCKSVSKLLNKLISNPSFSFIYANNSHSITAIGNNSGPFLDLIDFTSLLFSSHTLPVPDHSSIFGYCNGFICMLQSVESNTVFNIVLVNPLFNDFFQLPDQIVLCHRTFIAYGLGYCQFTNRYKVLKIVTSCVGRNDYQNNSEIFTIGVDRNWRSVKDANVPYNIVSGICQPNPNQQSNMVAFNSRIHWIVCPVRLLFCNLVPKWGGPSSYICAFDLKDEKVNAISLPPDVHFGQLGLIFDKLSILKEKKHDDTFDIWVMLEYGVDASWTKQFIFKVSVLPPSFDFNVRDNMVALSQGVLALSDDTKFLFYDPIHKDTIVFYLRKEFHDLSIYVPTFVSLKYILQL